MMNRRTLRTVQLLAGSWLLISLPCRAQVASVVDERGKLVFVNGDSPDHRSRSTISSRTVDSAGEPPFVGSSAVGATAKPPDRLDRIVKEAADRHSLDPALVKAVISTESSWNPRAISRKGAVGLMQLVPGTAQRFGVGNLFDPAQNVEGGTAYLKTLLDRYDGDLNKTLAAYNAGEHAVDHSGGIPAYPETQQYVRKVTDAYFRPGSGRTSTAWAPPKPPVRKEVQSNGRVVFTNE